MIHIKSEDFLEDIEKDEERFDNSNYEVERSLLIGKTTSPE